MNARWGINKCAELLTVTMETENMQHSAKVTKLENQELIHIIVPWSCLGSFDSVSIQINSSLQTKNVAFLLYHSNEPLCSVP